MQIPQIGDIREAHERIKPFVHHTPILTSVQINNIMGAELFFKCENFQKVGAFKFRGATNAVLSLSKEERSRGVVAHSSGNHAAALAHAAVSRGVKAWIVMPENAPVVKKEAVAGYGAEIIFCKPTLRAREESAARIIEEKGATLIHAYDNFYVIAGQGTAAIELIEDVDDIGFVVTPVGGGGLLSGCATAVKSINPSIRVIAAEPEKADDARRSFVTGELQPSINPETVADGLLTSLSERTFTIIRDKVDDILVVSEKSIIESMKLVWERMKIIIEPSSATVVALVKENPELFAGKRVGLIISGGNVDLRRLPF